MYIPFIDTFKYGFFSLLKAAYIYSIWSLVDSCFISNPITFFFHFYINVTFFQEIQANVKMVGLNDIPQDMKADIVSVLQEVLKLLGLTAKSLRKIKEKKLYAKAKFFERSAPGSDLEKWSICLCDKQH